MTQQTYRFIIDLNVGGAVAEALKQSGHDALFVGDTDQRMHDVDILRLAARERRIIVTLDNDFGELVYRSGEPHSGILLLRLTGASAAEKVDAVLQIVHRHGGQLSEHFCVYRSGRLRIRA